MRDRITTPAKGATKSPQAGDAGPLSGPRPFPATFEDAEAAFKVARGADLFLQYLAFRTATARPVQDVSAFPVQRLTGTQRSGVREVIPQIKELWSFFLLLGERPTPEEAGKRFAGGGADAPGLTEHSRRLQEIIGTMESISGASETGGAVDDLILESVMARLRSLVEAFEEQGGKYLEFLRESEAEDVASTENPILLTKDALYQAWKTLERLADPGKGPGKPPAFETMEKHSGVVRMDTPPLPEARAAAPTWLNRFIASNKRLASLRDDYGLTEIHFEGYGGHESRKRTNALLTGLEHVIRRQTHSYLSSESTLIVDFDATRQERDKRAFVRYKIDDRARVRVRIEHLVDVSGPSATEAGSSGKAPEAYGALPENVLRRQAAMKAKYGFGRFLEEHGTQWSEAELDRLDQVMGLVLEKTPQVAPMLKDLDVIRTVKGELKGEQAFYDGLAHTLSVASATFSWDEISFAGGGETDILPTSFRIISHELGHLIFAARHRAALTPSETTRFRAELGYAEKAKPTDIKHLKSRIFTLEHTLTGDKLFGDEEVFERWETLSAEEIRAERQTMKEEIAALRERLKKAESAASAAKPSWLDLSDDEETPVVERSRYLTKDFPKPIVLEFKRLMKEWRVGPISIYAAQQEGKIDEEMLAEAYSLYVTDPTFVHEVSPDMVEWFSTGKFLG